MVKRILVWGGIAFVLFFVAFKPSAAGAVVRQLGSVAADIFQGVNDFFGSLV